MTEGERLFIERVDQGVFEIRPDGTVWRVGVILGNASGTRVALREPVRIGDRLRYGHLHYGFKHGGPRHVLLHRIVYMHFKGEIPDGLVINHINGKADDNHPDNLEAVTQAENVRHMDEVIRTRKRGSQVSTAKLTDDDVRQMRSEYTGRPGQLGELAARFGVCKQNVHRIVRRQHWKHVS